MSAELPQTCGNNYKPEADAGNAGVMASMLLDKLKAASQGCDTSSMAAALAFKSNALGLVGVEGAGSLNLSDVHGCQLLQSIVGNYLNSVYTSRCIIQNSTNTAATEVVNIASVSFSAYGPGSVVNQPVNCPNGPTVIQNVQTVLKNFANLSVQSKSDIAQTVKQGMATTVDQLMKQTTGAGATPQGSASLTTINNKVETQDMMTQLSNASNSVQNKITQMAKGDFNAYNGGSTFAPCLINQNSVLDLQLAEIISEAYATTMTGEISAFMTATVKQIAEVENKAPPSALDIFKNPDFMSIIIGLAVLVIAAVIGYKYMKSKKGKAGLGKAGLGKAGLGGLGKAGLGGLGKAGLGGLGAEMGNLGGLDKELEGAASEIKAAFRYW
jgi:hypothetical protein